MGALDFLVFLGILLLLYVFYKVVKACQAISYKIKVFLNKFKNKNENLQS